MKKKVFIDGREGTTGLQIVERLQNRSELSLLRIDEEKRKDASERKRMINEADVVFLCLPDDAARESVSLLENENTIVIDASTAHRTLDGWAYGFPELGGQYRAAIAGGRRIAVPGCHASGFVAVVAPLVELGVLPADYPVTAHSVTGYSGAGKGMIAKYEDANRPAGLDSPRQYALALHHKHLPEMTKYAHLAHPPVFNPIIADYYCGMVVSVPLHTRLLAKQVSPAQLAELYRAFYKGQQFLSVLEQGEIADGFLAADTLAGTNRMEIIVCGGDEQLTVAARFDNLGKGASGAAVQCMNLALGLDEAAGLA
ncbi:MAG: N-acetyl-gamma-glutamyl-phosphate reductase [Acetanaerobacterium sp.]